MSIFKRVVTAPIIFIGRRIEKKHFTGKPILIVACPRSGTTLLLSILSAVPSLFAIPRQTYAFDRWRMKNGAWIPTHLHRLYREFIRRDIPVTAHRWLEKTPGHIRSIDKILKYFNDDVKIIHIVRDGRDVTVSTHPAYTDRRKYWVPVDRWVAEVSNGLSFKDHPSVHTLRYEDLVQDYKIEIQKIVQFIGEPFTETILNWTEHTHIKDSIHWGANVQQVHAKSLQKWKSPEHAERIQEFMNNREALDLLQKLGYPV